MHQQPIADYGIVGNLRTAALIGMDGSVDLLCFPRFDSPSVFAALLDPQAGGRFQIAPAHAEPKKRQLYLPDSNILLTRFLFEEGVAELSDFMSLDERGRLVRRAKTVRGEISFRMVCDPRFDYGRAPHRVLKSGAREVIFASEGLALRLLSDVDLKVVDGAAVAEFTLRADERAGFVLEAAGDSAVTPARSADFIAEQFKETSNYWHRWVSRSTYKGRWREMINRSALTLKLLTSREFGSIVAAPTFGLPEQIGGGRNWDYRYTWIRDASFTLYALIRLGYTDEAASFMQWIEARCGELRPDGSLQIMYGIDGRHALPEATLEHWSGYHQSRPVRIGNEAAQQLQLDIYGELMDSVYLYNKFGQPISHDLWMNLVRLVDFVCANWRRADEGIWEVRSGKHEFLFSRVMCWVAVDRAIRLAHKRSFPAPYARWYRSRDQIYDEIFASYWDAQRMSFVQRKGAPDLDAANLLMPLVKFIAPTDPRWLSTLAATQKELVTDSVVYRYSRAGGFCDGIEGEEGTFNMCSFWYVEALARAGDVDQARLIFEKALGYANHLGLYSEELGPRGEHLGNFPQAFSHLGLISAAYCLDRALNEARRPG